MKLARASQKEIDTLMRWLQARESAKFENAKDRPPAFMRVVFGYETLVENCCDPALDHLEFKPELLAAKEDAALLDNWENGLAFLIGKTNDGRWQAASQEPGLIGKALIGSSLRDLLRQIRDLQAQTR